MIIPYFYCLDKLKNKLNYDHDEKKIIFQCAINDEHQSEYLIYYE